MSRCIEGELAVRYFDIIKEKLSSLWVMLLLLMFAAIWSIYTQDGQINRDGLLYLKQAYLISEGSWKEGLALYPWPFFSILISIFHKVTNLHLQAVAHGLDLALFGIATFFYLKTLQLIYKEKQIIFYGGIILLSFIPIMDDYLSMILRDHGLWAGCMMGTYFYFKNLQNYSLKNSISWQFGFLFAGLFRPEGLVFLMLIPLWNFYQNNFQILKNLFIDYVLSISLFILCVLNIVFLNTKLLSLINISRLDEFAYRPIQFFSILTRPLPIYSDDKFLAILLDDYSLLITGVSLFLILIFKWIKGLGVLHGGLFLYFCIKQKNIKNIYQKHICFLIILSFILVSFNLFTVYVLTNRYWVIHWFWIFMLISPLLLEIFNSRRTKQNDILKILVSFYLFFSIVNVFMDSNKTNVDYKAGQYLRSLNIADQESVNLVNADRVGYYAGLSFQSLIDASSNEHSNTNFLIFNGDLHEATIAAGSNYQLHKSFAKNHQGIYIFKRKSID